MLVHDPTDRLQEEIACPFCSGRYRSTNSDPVLSSVLRTDTWTVYPPPVVYGRPTDLLFIFSPKLSFGLQVKDLEVEILVNRNLYRRICHDWSVVS